MLKITSLKVIKKFDVAGVRGFVLYAINDEFFGVRVSDIGRIYGLSSNEIRYMNGFFGSKFCRGFGFYGLGDSVYVKYNLMENVFKSIDYYYSFNPNYVKQIGSVRSFFNALEKEVKYWFSEERKLNTRAGTHFTKPYIGSSVGDIIGAFKGYISYESQLKQQTEESVRLLRGKNKILSEYIDSMNRTCDRINRQCDALKEDNEMLSKKIAVQGRAIKDNILSLRELSEWAITVNNLKNKILDERKYKKQSSIDAYVYNTMARKYGIDFTSKRAALKDNISSKINMTNYDVLLSDKHLRDLYLDILEQM